jgi:hypothetical protein
MQIYPKNTQYCISQLLNASSIIQLYIHRDLPQKKCTTQILREKRRNPSPYQVPKQKDGERKTYN